LGILSISKNINFLTREIDNQIKNQGISFAILSKNLDPLTQWSEDPLFNISLYFRNRLKDVNLSEYPSGIISRQNLVDSLLGGNSIYAIYDISSQYPFFFVLGYNAKLSNAALQSMIRDKFFQLVLVALFIMTFLWLIRHRVISPVIELSNITENVAKGESFQELSREGPHEIEQLAKQIKKTHDYIAERFRIENELRNKLTMWRMARESEEFTNQTKIQFFESISQTMHFGLQAMKSASDALQEEKFGALENEKYRALARDIYEETKLILANIKELKTLAEQDASRVLLKEVSIDVDNLLQDMLGGVKERFEKRRIEIHMSLQDTLPQLQANPTAFSQTIQQLLHYAAYSAAPGSLITLDTFVGQKDAPTTLFLFRCSIKEPTDPLPEDEVYINAETSLVQLSLSLLHVFVKMLDGDVDLGNKQGSDRLLTLAFPKERIVYRG
jgi:signal transduction histidine kinase